MKILIVDDSQANIDMLRMILGDSRYEVFEATSGQEGLEILKRERIQLVLLDWMMPDLNGLEFVKYVRGILTDYYIYIIMVTAKDGYDARVQGLESGVDDFINRPYGNREMRARVRVGERIIEVENALKRTTSRLEIAQHEWEATADAINQVVCLLDRDGKIIRANRTLEEWGLVRVKEAAGQLLFDVMHNVYTDFAEQLSGVWEVVQMRVDDDLGFEFVGNDLGLGHHFHVQVEPIDPIQVSRIRDESFAAISIQDITHRRKLELALEQEHKKSERLLHNTLPVPISNRLKEGESIIADELENVSVLFADLVGFTNFSKQVPPTRLVSLLNVIFSEFDSLTEKHGLEKIKTIGDSYMAVCGVPLPHDQHALAAVDMALEMLRVLQEFNEEHNLNFNLRIGVHSGPVVAGVIGAKKFAYDLWGDTVNKASRLESAGEPGKVHISSATAQLLSGEYALNPRETIFLKGIGDAQTYFVEAASSPVHTADY